MTKINEETKRAKTSSKSSKQFVKIRIRISGIWLLDPMIKILVSQRTDSDEV